MNYLRLLLGIWMAAQAATAVADHFDYYTFSVSLAPAFCDQNPRWRDSRQCRDRLPLTVHGLWPDAARGRAPENCAGADLALSPALEHNLRGTMPDEGLRQYEWKKHGRCSGLSAEAYFSLIDRTFSAIRWPDLLKPQGRDVIVARDSVLGEFRRLNPAFPERGVILRCESGKRPPLLSEIRLCLSADGHPVECAGSVRPNCPVAVKIRAP
ncbi:MAG TPA: hypothetical protein VFM34_05820 [Moraxellaceae bacterium]|nr:hypothetical protein [Moraxellaceae bacterium]